MNASRGHSGNGQFACIAIGSNLGDPVQLVLRAMDRLESLSEKPLRRSSLWRSAPVDCPPGSPIFVNAAVALMPEANATPESLLRQLQDLEREFGRRPKTTLNSQASRPGHDYFSR